MVSNYIYKYLDECVFIFCMGWFGWIFKISVDVFCECGDNIGWFSFDIYNFCVFWYMVIYLM